MSNRYSGSSGAREKKCGLLTLDQQLTVFMVIGFIGAGLFSGWLFYFSGSSKIFPVYSFTTKLQAFAPFILNIYLPVIVLYSSRKSPGNWHFEKHK